MKQSTAKIGLVLSGGGAKGAYQVGVVKYLDELGFNPSIIAGTSIGALNGAILSSSKNFSEGAINLAKTWERLGKTELLQYNYDAIKKNALKMGKPFLSDFSAWLSELLINSNNIKDNTIFDPIPMDSLIREIINPKKIKTGTELWISAFPSLGIKGLPFDLLDALVNVARVFIGSKSEWFRVQDFEEPEAIYNVLLASAAIPIAFPRRKINGKEYIDGGIEDNTPLGALKNQGCTHAIVVHLSNGNVWSRHDFPGINIIEIRPTQLIQKSEKFIIGGISSILDFSPSRIEELTRSGYSDAKAILDPILQIFDSLNIQRKASNMIIKSTKRLLDDPPL